MNVVDQTVLTIYQGTSNLDEGINDSGARYRALLEAAPDAMVVVNQYGEIVLLNLHAEKQFGFHRDQLVGQPITRIIPSGFAERLIADDLRTAAEALAQQMGTGIELVGRRQDGSEFPMEIMLSPLRQADGILVTAAIRDITARKAAERHLIDVERRRQNVEELLRQSEENYRILLDGIEDYAIYMMDPVGTIISWNAGAERIKGYRADQIIGQNFSRFFPVEEVFEGRPQEVLRLAATHGRHEERGMRVRRDGSQFLASLTFTALRDPSGTLRGFSEFSHDLSASRDAGAKYRGLLEAAPDAMVVTSERGDIVLLNLRAEREFGYHLDELVGQPITNIIPNGFAARLIADDLRSAEQALAQHIGSGIELVGRRRNGSTFPIEIMLSPLESADGTLITAAIRDITVRKASERELVEAVEQRRLAEQQLNDERQRALTEAFSHAVITADMDGIIRSANPAAALIYGYPIDELVGAQMWRLAPEARRGQFAEDLQRFRVTGEAPLDWQGNETAARHSSGTEVPTEVSFGAYGTGSDRRLTWVVRDISSRKHLQAQLLQASKMDAIGRLAGGVAHDFNNILTAIVGNASLLADVVADGDDRDLVRNIEDAAERATRLTQQLLAFGRRQMLEPRVLSIAAVVDDISPLLRSVIGEDIRLATLASPSLGRVRADPTQVEQVIVNLVVNAREAMPTGGRLTIEVAGVELDHLYMATHPEVVPGPYIMLAVTDTGSGMDPATQVRIFEPFFTTKPGGGGGLGLATVYGIVKQHGGSISVYSELDRGTVFKVYLPQVFDELHRPEPAPVLGPSGPATATILLAEDDEAVRGIAVTTLTRQGYRVLSADSGIAALAVAQAHEGQIDLLLTDVVMGGMSGRDLSRELNVVRPATRTLYVSGYTENTIVHHGVLEPGIAFLPKPFTPAALVRKVADVLAEGPRPRAD